MKSGTEIIKVKIREGSFMQPPIVEIQKGKSLSVPHSGMAKVRWEKRKRDTSFRCANLNKIIRLNSNRELVMYMSLERYKLIEEKALNFLKTKFYCIKSFEVGSVVNAYAPDYK